MERLRELRVRRFWTQQDLAARAGVPWQTLQRWETGRAQPRPRSLRRLCAALAVDLGELLTSDDLARVGTQPRPRPDDGVQDLAAPTCTGCGQPLTAGDRWHAQDGAVWHPRCRKSVWPRPTAAVCCTAGPCGR